MFINVGEINGNKRLEERKKSPLPKQPPRYKETTHGSETN